MFGGAIGSSIATEIAVRLQGKSFSRCKTPNPMTREHVSRLKEAVAKEVKNYEQPTWLQSLLRDPSQVHVVAIGGETCAFRQCAQATKQNPFTLEVLEKAIDELCEGSDEKFRSMGFLQESMVLPKLILIYSVMKCLGIVKVKYEKTNGSARGVLITEEIWKADS
mmetsp:Transcript_27348/g.66503  ORF Transcript_27348/g.66503 Transcript_27348/m.66503 type:complete len:165 (-) Transcript_27348:115-609(-)